MGDQSDRLEAWLDLGAWLGHVRLPGVLLLFPQGLTRGVVRFWEKRLIGGGAPKEQGRGGFQQQQQQQRLPGYRAEWRQGCTVRVGRGFRCSLVPAPPRHPSLKLQSGAAGQDKGKVGVSARGPDRSGGSEQSGGDCLLGEGSLPRRTC